MSADDRFRVAGEAACLLEDLGFSAVARKKNELVTLEFWPSANAAMDQSRSGMRRIVDEDDIAPERLASECVQTYGGKTALH